MNADRIAAIYRWIEYLAFGGALQRCRCAHLNQIPAAGQTLILGEGDGRFLAALLPQLSGESSVDVIEASSKMVTLAKQRIPADNQTQVRFFQRAADATCPLEPRYDVVVTNFFLDCLTQHEAAQLIEKITTVLKPGGRWIVGEFQLPTHGLRRWHAIVWLRVMYTFFGLTTGLMVRKIPGYRRMFCKAGLTLTHLQQQRFGLIVSEVWQKTVLG